MQTYVGILRPFHRGGVVDVNDQDRIVSEVWIPEQHLNGAPFGMMVVCETDEIHPQTMPVGRIIEVLGDPSRPDVGIQSIIRAYGLSEQFSQAVMDEAKHLPHSVTEDVIQSELKKGRRDLRYLPTLTIDGIDAKDLDDALSYEKRQDIHVVYVHIADVSHYVQEGSAIEAEAIERGTSVYLVDRVIPMHPPALSNGICSLNPHVDRLALTVELHYNDSGERVWGDVYESLIHSDIRGNYEDVLHMIQTNEVLALYQPVYNDLMALYRLSRILRQIRFDQGALGFEFPETEIVLDEDGYPIEIKPRATNEAHELIEEYMIAANIYIAERFHACEAPFMYRVHEAPNDEKLMRISDMLRRLDVPARLSSDPTPKEVAYLLEQIKDHPYYPALSKLILEAQAKARYDSSCLGHFGLALSDYAHFTSPIRRYPDAFIHRVIKGYIHGDVDFKQWLSVAQTRADHASDMERLAMMAERETQALKMAEYMSEHLGEVFEGTVTGFSYGGLFVALDNTVSGMVPFRSMNDYYVYSEEQMLAQGERSGRVFRIGDRISVMVARADIEMRRIDFELVDEAVGMVEPPLIDASELARMRKKEIERAQQRILNEASSAASVRLHPMFQIKRRASGQQKRTGKTRSASRGVQQSRHQSENEAMSGGRRARRKKRRLAGQSAQQRSNTASKPHSKKGKHRPNKRSGNKLQKGRRSRR